MQPLTPALEDLLEHLEDLDRRLGSLRAGEGAAPAGDLLLLKPDLAEIYDQVDALIADIRSIDAAYRRYHDRFLNLPAVCLCTGVDGVVLEANRAAGALLGIAPARLQGLPLDAHLHPESIPAFRLAVAALGRGEELPAQEFLLVRADGSTVPAAAAVSASYGPGGRVTEFQWVFRDISREKQFEEALRESEERSRTVVESQTELICRRLPDGTITFANDAYCGYVGIPCGDLIGRRYALTIPADDQARIQESLASLTPDHPVSTVEHRVIMPDGSVRWQQWTDTAFFDERGSVVEYQSVGRDITDARMAGEALLLANRKLNLLSDVTRHDILNRLTVLTGYLALFREQVSDPELLEYCRKEEEAIRDIQRYMAFTAEYRDVGVTAPAWRDIRRIVSEAAAALDPGKIAVEVRTGDLEVYADPLIVRVFANLIDNSLRHGGRVTRICIYPEESDRGISLVYEDDGIGIPYEVKENLFKRGFGRQTGFGLFLSREILAITDLSIRETGEPGKGARFEIGVPPGFYRFTGRGQAR
ncbi:PAS domain S-box protein [Methanoculleus chikugoensis]|uniref:histidine kinase n=1 Tax=Methanoculleus chikugoensis TaxID=118126 RepID=A0ABN5XPW5_9EURY|nr:PAS domain S-box protein [Methanoculleus chikugoensis]BBL69111.1 hypothetical protein MchiMG62_22920 [Methanoculleus chikugoensis]